MSIKGNSNQFKLLIGFIFIFVTTLNLSSQSLNGSYTIGGANPDYQDFNAAVVALNSNGISGNVTFNVRSGEYIEKIKINQIVGSSSNARILFQSETGNAEDVVLKHMHLGSFTNSNYTVYLDGTDYISFEYLTFKAVLNRDYNRVLYVDNDADHVSFKSNRFISWYENDNNSNENDAVTFINSKYLRFVDNYVEGGNTGLFVGGAFTTNEWFVKGNTFNKQHSYGIKISRGTDIDIIDNTIESQDGFESYFQYGMYISQVKDSITVARNQIYLKKGGRGIYIGNHSSAGRKAFTLANNMITIGATSVSGAHRRGVFTYRNDTIGIFYNSISIEGPGNSGEIIHSTGNDTLMMYNNMFTHLGGGKIYYSNSSANTLLISNYNNLYNSNQTIAELSGATYTSLANLRNGKGIEGSSFAIIPLYLRSNYLIPKNSSIYERGVPISEVQLDFFGNNRSMTVTDVGVFEGKIPNNDAAINAISISNYVSCPGDTFPVYATILNLGFANLTTANVSLEINDSVYQSTWNGNLVKYGVSGNILLGNISAPLNSRENWKVFTSNPNGILDSLVANDTLSGELTKAMKGHFRVGSSSLADFTSLEKAFEEMKIRGICDSTFLDIETGTYDEQVIIPTISGTSATNPLIIQSLTRDSSSVLFRFYGSSSRNYIFQFEDASHTIVRNLSLWNRSSSYNVVFQLLGNTESISLENNYIKGEGAGAFGNRSLINLNFGFRNTIPKNITIKNNYLYKGGYQIYIEGYSSNRTQNIVVENNYFNKGIISIYGEYFDGLEIIKNRFSGYRSTCVEILNSNGRLKIAKNKFNINSNYSTTVIKINNSDGTVNEPIEISNNFIRADAQYAYGVRLTNVNHLNLYHNNFHLNGDRYMLEFSSTISDLDSKNNIFYSSQTGKAYGTNLIITPAMFSSNYNLFYTNNPDIHDIRGTGMSLQNWQFITNYDTNSITFNPLFVNDTNLHVTNHIPINGTGINLPSIVDDIDNELRKTPRDIGADEFDIDSTNYYDLELESFTRHGMGLCAPSDSIFISVVNHSNFTMDSFYTKWGLLDRSFDSTKHYMSILSRDTVEVFVGTFDFIKNNFYKFDVRIIKPNGIQDNTQFNNEKILDYNLINSIQIFSKPSLYCGTDTELYIQKYPTNSMLWSTGNVSNSILVNTPGTYSITVTDNTGCIHQASIIIQ